MQPDILHLIPCEAIQIDSSNFHRCNVLGLVTSIRSTAVPPFPVVRPEFNTLIVWPGCQGTGELMLRIVEERSAKVIFRTRPRQVRFVGDVAAVGGVVFRMQNCVFPAAGLYWIEIVYAGSVIGHQRLFLRE
jgi:hypothetical protein